MDFSVGYHNQVFAVFAGLPYAIGQGESVGVSDDELALGSRMKCAPAHAVS
jgi:hypothetical protein